MKVTTDQDIEQSLQRITKVDAPPFLFTRISARLQENTHFTLPVTIAMAASIALLALLNINFLMADSDIGNNPIEEIASQVSTNNHLYNE